MYNQPGQRRLRQGRYIDEGLFYFVTTVTKNREKIFLRSTLAKTVLNSLHWLHDHHCLMLIAAVVMPDHLHFVTELKGTPLPKVMHSLKSFTANQINEILGRRGPVWERQYYEHAIRDEGSLVEMINYCLENPVRKGIVDDFKKYPHWYCMYQL
jgi:REP element-mobilizing transposase RayT